MRISDCSSDVCSSDLTTDQLAVEAAGPAFQGLVKAPEPKQGPTSRRMPAFEPLNEAPEDRPPTAARAGPSVFHKNRFVMPAPGVGTVLFVTRVCIWPRAGQGTDPVRPVVAGTCPNHCP